MVNERLQHSDFLKLGFVIAALALIWNLPTIGGNLMPRNFMGWFGIIVIASLLMSFSIWKEKLFYSKFLLFLFIPPAAILFHGLIFEPSETMHYYFWLAAGASLMFPIYLFGLYQVDDADEIWLKVSNLLLLILIVQTFITILMPSTGFGRYIIDHMPLELKAREAGFHQANLMASFISASIIWSWALHLKHQKMDKKYLAFIFFITLFLSFVIFKTGSRTGFISLLFGYFLIAVYAYRLKKFTYSAWFIVAIIFAFLLEQTGFFGESRRGGSIAATVDLLGGQNTVARLLFWKVSFLAGLDEFIFGHGLGSFQQAYLDTYLKYKPANADWFHVSGLAHPHNEILMHWVEMGLYGIFFIIVPAVIFLFKLFLANKKYAFLLIGSIFPIVLHTQTEMVLHASGAHWLLLGLIIASLTGRSKLEEIEVSKLLIALPIGIAVLGSWLTVSTAIVGQSAFYNKLYADSAKDLGHRLKYLTQGDELNHWVYGTETNDRVIKEMMAVALNTNNRNAITKFLPRLLDMNTRWQQTDTWAQIAQAYLVLGDIAKYKSHMNKVRILDPKYADFLEKAFDVKLDPVKS